MKKFKQADKPTPCKKYTLLNTLDRPISLEFQKYSIKIDLTLRFFYSVKKNLQKSIWKIANSKKCDLIKMNLRSLIVLTSLLSLSTAVTIRGQFNTDNFYLFLNKFGFIKTEKTSDQKATFGYIFGNITASHDFSPTLTLAVLDRHHFLEFYGNRWDNLLASVAGMLIQTDFFLFVSARKFSVFIFHSAAHEKTKTVGWSSFAMLAKRLWNFMLNVRHCSFEVSENEVNENWNFSGFNY